MIKGLGKFGKNGKVQDQRMLQGHGAYQLRASAGCLRAGVCPAAQLLLRARQCDRCVGLG